MKIGAKTLYKQYDRVFDVYGLDGWLLVYMEQWVAVLHKGRKWRSR